MTRSSAVSASPDGRGPQRQKFSVATVSEFLDNGWLLALGPDQVLVGWGAWTTTAQPAEDIQCALFAPDFYLESKEPWRFTSAWDLIDRDVFAAEVLRGLGVDDRVEDQRLSWIEPDRGEFEMALCIIREGMTNRGLQKAVPVVFATASVTIDRQRKARMLRRLVQPSAQLFPYGYWSSREGMMGATPEVLFSMRAGAQTELKSMALAGTRERQAGAGEALLEDPKERHEHQLLIEDLRDVLAPLGSVKFGETVALELPSLVHLHTPISVKTLAPIAFIDAVEILHPTPALGVAPRRLGFAEIKLWDKSIRRKHFGAPFGARFQMEEGQVAAHCLVAIRNIQWQEGELNLGSGCGIVPESEPEREWRELQLKRDSVKQMLGL